MKDTKIFKSKYFLITVSNEKNWTPYNKDWVLHRKFSKEESKSSGKKFDEEIFAILYFSAPDIYNCSELKIETVNNFTAEQFEDIINFALICFPEFYFIRIRKNLLDKDLETKMVDRKLLEDSLDSDFWCTEKRIVKSFFVYCVLCMICGMCFGIAIGKGMLLGMSIGTLIGLGLGLLADKNTQKDFDKIKAARLGQNNWRKING